MGECFGILIALVTTALQPYQVRPCHLLRNRSTDCFHSSVGVIAQYRRFAIVLADATHSYLCDYQNITY